MIPDAFVLPEALDVVADVPDDELAVGAAADEDGRLERMPQKCLGKPKTQIIILPTLHIIVQGRAKKFLHV